MTSFDEFVKQVELEAEQEGPAAVAQLAELRSRYTLARDLLTLRKGAGMTQTQLAEVSGIAQADISRIERGEGNPTEATLAALAKPLGSQLRLVPVLQPA